MEINNQSTATFFSLVAFKKFFLKFEGAKELHAEQCSRPWGGTRQDGSQFHIHFEQEAADAVAPLREKREEIST